MTETIRTFTRDLFCALTEAEVAARAAELARITTELSQMEDKKKAAMSSYKDKIDRAIVDARSLARKVSERREMRTVECRLNFDYRLGRAYLVRTDTSEVLEERPLTAEERQPKLPIGEKKCRVCGCTTEKGCELAREYNCSWVDGEEDLCDNPECLRKAGYTEESIREIWKDAQEVLETPAEASDAEEKTATADGPVFVDDLGRHCQVAFDDMRAKWGAFRVKKHGGFLRIKQVPLYQDRANAEKGLVAFAQKAGFLTLQAHEGLQKAKEAAHG